MVNLNSTLYKEHPDWVLHAGKHERTLTRNQMVLNVGLPEVQNFIIDTVSGILEAGPVSYVKWDNNRGMCSSIQGSSMELVADSTRHARACSPIRLIQIHPRPLPCYRHSDNQIPQRPMGRLCFRRRSLRSRYVLYPQSFPQANRIQAFSTTGRSTGPRTTPTPSTVSKSSWEPASSTRPQQWAATSPSPPTASPIETPASRTAAA